MVYIPFTVFFNSLLTKQLFQGFLNQNTIFGLFLAIFDQGRRRIRLCEAFWEAGERESSATAGTSVSIKSEKSSLMEFIQVCWLAADTEHRETCQKSTKETCFHGCKQSWLLTWWTATTGGAETWQTAGCRLAGWCAAMWHCCPEKQTPDCCSAAQSKVGFTCYVNVASKATSRALDRMQRIARCTHTTSRMTRRWCFSRKHSDDWCIGASLVAYEKLSRFCSIMGCRRQPQNEPQRVTQVDNRKESVWSRNEARSLPLKHIHTEGRERLWTQATKTGSYDPTQKRCNPPRSPLYHIDSEVQGEGHKTLNRGIWSRYNEGYVCT